MDNENVSSTSSTGSSSTNNYINHISANTTATTSSGGADTTCSVSPTTSSSSETTKLPDSQANQNNHSQSTQNALIEQLVQQQKLFQSTNKATLPRQMWNRQDSNDSPSQPQKFNNNTQYRINTLNPHSSFNSGHLDINSANPQPPSMPPPPSSQMNATTAYLVQTPNGNALLIPPQTPLNPTNQFMQTNAGNNTGTMLNRHNSTTSNNPYGITTIPFQTAASMINENNMTVINGNTLVNGFLPQSNSNMCFNRPESVNSTNVYQTIDATEKNGYLYPVESGYDSSTFYNNSTSINNKSFNNTLGRNKYRTNYQHHLQQQFIQQQQSQFAKLLENNSNTMHTNNTSSNLFSSPTLSVESSSNNNRRLRHESKFSRIQYQLGRKLRAYCSWKFMALLCLFIILNLFSFTIYLAVMRMYNLNWHLQGNSQIRLQKSPSPVPHSIGNILDTTIPPNELFTIQTHIYSPMPIKFNFSISQNSNIGVYMDRNSLPTLTKFKHFETLNSKDLILKTTHAKSQSQLLNTAFVQNLEEGVWFIAIFNDNEHKINLRFHTEFYNTDNSLCPMNCHGKGDCDKGVCQCFTGYTGPDCSEKSCPVLCNGNGVFEHGKCQCNLGFHGNDCSLTLEQCQVPNCNNKGDCLNGQCQCYKGYSGEFCDQITCESNCSNNGICQSGTCQCFAGYSGYDCSQIVPSISSLCQNHGEFQYESKTCKCNSGWTGPDCSRNEHCLDIMCTVCVNGWSGVNCMQQVPLQCDIRCQEHGICVNGTCNCSPGYQGRNCDINSCPKGCSSNGVCEKSVNQYTRYQCVCSKGWSGQACDIPIELYCNDDIDNDNDGLTDCMDSECCSLDSCKLSIACQTSPEPKDRLLRKQPPSLSATFYEKMRFLIEDNSVQSFANSNSFRESQVSVIRGQVLFKNGQPLIGVKVSSASSPVFGYTLTRQNGIFDIMVNGGGSVQLEFTRKDLKAKVISVTTIWNQFVNIDTVHLFLIGDSLTELTEDLTSCHQLMHNSTQVEPIVKTSWKQIRTYYYDNSVILPDSGVVRNELKLANNHLRLVYTSNQAAGFSSTIFILLTKEVIPDTLKLIHLKIIVEGVLHKETLEAYPSQSFEYAWDRRNAYEQRVYGVTFAKVMIGYEYEDCGYIYWDTYVVKLAGYDLGSSEIGSWNVDVHHRLNTQQGILHKGDGSTVYLNEMQKQVEIVAGQSRQSRAVDCEMMQCSGNGRVKFYTPSSLTINKDGLIFIADYNYVWMLNNSGIPERVLELRTDQPYKHHLATDQTTGDLFLIDSVNKNLLKLKNTQQVSTTNLKQNVQTSSTFCFTQTNQFSAECQRPKKLQNPGSFAFDQNQIMYFIDTNQIKSITQEGILRTLIGSGNDQQIYKPMGCNTSYSLAAMKLYWPSVLRINPIDNSIYILDENVIYKITPFNTIEVVLGVPYGCPYTDVKQPDAFTKLNSPIDMAFNTEGDLYILENDGANTKQIRLLRSTGQLETFYDGINKELSVGQYFTFSNPVAIAVHQNRSVYVLDKTDNVLYHIKSSIEKDEYSSTYTLVSPETRETYIFNRFGLHLSTVDLLTGIPKFNFTYSGNAMYGKLVSIVDQHKVLMSIKRDFHGRAQLIQMNDNLSIKLKLFNNMLKSLVSSDRSYEFKYLSNSGLLTSSSDYNGRVTLYNYEPSGKVNQIIEPNNMVTNVDYQINASGIVTRMNRANLYSETWITNGSRTFIYKNGKLETMMEANKDTFSIRALASEAEYQSFQTYYKSTVSFQSQPHPIRIRNPSASFLHNSATANKLILNRPQKKTRFNI